jgi:hypothetical protein
VSPPHGACHLAPHVADRTCAAPSAARIISRMALTRPLPLGRRASASVATSSSAPRASPNPHRLYRLTAASSPEGFRTPTLNASPRLAMGRHPKPSTKAVLDSHPESGRSEGPDRRGEADVGAGGPIASRLVKSVARFCDHYNPSPCGRRWPAEQVGGGVSLTLNGFEASSRAEGGAKPHLRQPCG